MPEYIHIPTDFERTPEYRILVSALRAHSTNSQASVEAVATQLWMRLAVELSMQARTTNKPGLLANARLYEESVSGLLGDTEPVKLLIEAGVLQERQGQLWCVWFEACNLDKAANYLPREKRGQMHSQFVRQQGELTHMALQQTQLLPPEIYRRADGNKMDSGEVQRAMYVITRVDRALKLPNRNRGGFSQGLVADACAAGVRYDDEVIKEVCFWLMDHRDEPATPTATEQVLARWEDLLVMSGQRKVKGELI